MRILLFLALLIPSLVQAQETIANGLTLTIPSIGSSDWGVDFRDDFAEPISSHDHTGGGKGLQLGASSITANALNGTNFRLSNNQYLRSRNVANSADVDLLKYDNNDRLIIEKAPIMNDLTASRFMYLDVSKRITSPPASTVRTGLGLDIGVDVQAYDADLTTLGALGAGARTALGLGSIATQDSNNVTITGGVINGITDIGIADGGTAASDVTGARNNFGLGTGDSPTFTGATYSGLTASLPVFTDGSKALSTPSVATAWAALNAASTWSTWVPTFSGDGVNTLACAPSSCTVQRARYVQTGKTVCMNLIWLGTVSGAAGVSVAYTLPVTAADVNMMLPTTVQANPGVTKPTASDLFSTTIAVIHDPSGSTLPNGDYIWRVNACYEAA